MVCPINSHWISPVLSFWITKWYIQVVNLYQGYIHFCQSTLTCRRPGFLGCKSDTFFKFSIVKFQNSLVVSCNHEVTPKGVRPAAGVLANFQKKFCLFFQFFLGSHDIIGYYEQKYVIFHSKNAKFSLGDETTPIFCRFRKKR